MNGPAQLASTPITYREACKQALRQALIADPRVFLMGEDIARYGGCYAVTKGLSESSRLPALLRFASAAARGGAGATCSP